MNTVNVSENLTKTANKVKGTALPLDVTDPAAADKLAGLLVRSGLEVGRATAAFSASL